MEVLDIIQTVPIQDLVVQILSKEQLWKYRSHIFSVKMSFTVIVRSN